MQREGHSMNQNEMIPVWEKQNLTIKEAALYSNIGQNKIRDMLRDPACTFSLRIGA